MAFKTYMRDCKRCNKIFQTTFRTSDICLKCYKPNAPLKMISKHFRK